MKMLKSIPVQTISELFRIGMKRTEPANFTRLPYFEYYEKFNPCDVILFNSSLQVLVAMAYHNDYYSGCHVPVSIEFFTPMPVIEFLSSPTIQLFPSVFKKLRVFTRDNLISGSGVSALVKYPLHIVFVFFPCYFVHCNCFTNYCLLNSSEKQLTSVS